MEGMPRFPALIPDLKVPSNEYDDEFVYRLKEYILMHFQADPSNYDEAIAEIRKLKKEILKGHTDVEAACVLKRYYAQLLMMKNRFPMESGGECKTPFSWYERALDIPTAQSIADIGFEMACIMYQIGSVHAHIASEETRQDENSIKNAFMHFQYAAWPLQHIRDAMDVASYATSDFDKELLTFHVNVLLGQAQECLLEKSMLDHRGHAVVAKLAAYLRDLYNSCNRLLLNSNTAVEFVSSKKMKLWSRTCTIKSEIYGCIAMLYMGYKAEEDQKFGDRLGYCQAAEQHLQKAIQVIEKEDRIEMRDTVQFVADVVKARLENAKKENDFIYHERIPKIDELLGSVEGLGKVHPLSFDPLDSSVGGEDVFGTLVPPTVLSAVSEYEEEKAKLKREVLKRVAERDEELQGFLGTLNATELGLHSAGPSFQLPEILLERNASMHSQIDAVPRLLEKLQQVDELARVADSKLTGMTTRLASVDLPEFTSDEGFRAISDEISRLQDHHNQARANNAELHKALAAHSTNIHLLSLPLYELTAKLSPTADVPPASTKEGAALVRVLDKAHEMQTQRATLVQRLCDELEADDIGKKLLAERDVDNKATFAEELKKHDTTIKYIDTNLAAQENILHHLTEANADFAEQRKVIQENNKARSEQVMTLVAACDIYTDICDKADDGKRFYDKLIDRMNKMSMAIEGIEAAYGQEKEKIEGEKRALEQKMAALRAAKEAREAMADFGGIPPLPGAGGMPKPSGDPQKGPRPRLGDYMDFYRNKMGARGMPPPAPVMPQLPPMQPPSMHFPPAEVSPAGPPSPAPSSIADYHPDVHQEYVFPPQRMGAPYQPAGSYDPRLTPGGASPNPAQWNNAMHGQQHQQAHGYQSPYVPREMTPPHFQQQHQQPAVVNQSTPLPPGANPAAPTIAPSHQPVPPQHFQPSQMPPPSSAYQPLAARSSQTNVVSNQLPQNFQQQYHPAGNNTAMPPSSQPAVNLSQQFGSQPAVATQSNFQQYGSHPLAGSYQQYSGQPAVIPQPAPAPPVQQYQQQQQQFINQPPAVGNFHQYGNQPGVSPAPPNTTLPAQSIASRPPQPVVSNTHLSQHHFQLAASSAPSSQPPPAVNNGFTYSGMPTTSPVPPAVSNQQYNQPAGHNAQPSFPQQQMPPSQPVHQNLTPGSQFVQPAAVISSVTSQPTTSFTPSQPPVSSAPSQPAQQQFQQPAAPATVSPAPWGAPRNNFGAPPSASPWHRPQTQSPWHQSAPPSSFNQPQQVGQAPAPPTPAQTSYQAPPTQQTSNMDLLSSLLGDIHLPAPIQPSQTTAATTPFGGGQMETQTLQRAAAATSSEVVTTMPAQTVPKTMTVIPSMSDSSMGNVRPAAAVLPMQQQKTTTAVAETPILSMVNASSISVLPQVTSPKAMPPVQTASLTELADPEKFKIGDGDKSRLEKRQLHAAIRGNAPLPSLDPLDPLNQLDPFWSIKKT